MPEECEISCNGRCVLLNGGTMEAQAECFEDIYEESLRLNTPIPAADLKKAERKFQKLNDKLEPIVRQVVPDLVLADDPSIEPSLQQAKRTRQMIYTFYGKNKLGQVPLKLMMKAGKLLVKWPEFFAMNSTLAHGEPLN